MTEKDRLNNAIKLLDVDRPPCICPGGMMNPIVKDIMEKSGVFFPQAHTDRILMAELAQKPYEFACFENYALPFCMTCEAESMGSVVDLGSDLVEPRVVAYAINSVEEMSLLSPINLNDKRVNTVIEAISILAGKKKNVPIIANLTGPISLATSLMEPTVFYREMRKKNAKTHEFMSFISGEILKFGKKQIEAGADVITISDPSGTGEILGPNLFEEFTVEYFNKIARGIKEYRDNFPVVLHICGKMHSVYDLLPKLFADVLSFDAMVNLAEIKSICNKAVMGNISTYALEFAGREKIAALTMLSLNKETDIIAPACGIGNASSIANIQEILKTVRESAGE